MDVSDNVVVVDRCAGHGDRLEAVELVTGALSLGPGEELLPGHPRLAWRDIHGDKHNTPKEIAHGSLPFGAPFPGGSLAVGAPGAVLARHPLGHPLKHRAPDGLEGLNH